MTEHRFGHTRGPFDDERPVRPCIRCRTPVRFDGQPGDGRCDACGIRQYLIEPSRFVRTREGWAYLATVIDFATRRVVGWALADHMETDLVAGALHIAIAARRRPPG